MELYKQTLRLESSLVTSLKGDTIWGHIAWGIAVHEGEQAITAFLEEAKRAPNLIVSSAFPAGYLCKPYPAPRKRTEMLSLTKYADIKKQKKQRYAVASEYLSVTTHPLMAGASKPEPHTVKQPYFTSDTRMHNSIDRYSSTVMEGNLYTATELWASHSFFDMYILSSFSPERLTQLLTWAFENGYGADASIGKGKISLSGTLEPVQAHTNSSRYMALAPFVVPDAAGVTELRAELFLRTGKIGGAFASSLSPYKKTVLLYDEGAVFTSATPIQYMGALLQNVHTDPRICQAAFAPVIPITDSIA